MLVMQASAHRINVCRFFHRIIHRRTAEKLARLRMPKQLCLVAIQDADQLNLQLLHAIVDLLTKRLRDRSFSVADVGHRESLKFTGAGRNGIHKQRRTR